MLYTVGSVVSGHDSELARGAWAAVWYTAGWHPVVGACEGRQRAPRVEQSAVAWVVLVALVCVCIIRGIVALRARRGAGYAQGLDGNLWAGVASSPPCGRWVWSHLTSAEALAAGRRLSDWAGSTAADAAASGAAACLRVLLEARSRRLRYPCALSRSVCDALGLTDAAVTARFRAPPDVPLHDFSFSSSFLPRRLVWGMASGCGRQAHPPEDICGQQALHWDLQQSLLTPFPWPGV